MIASRMYVLRRRHKLDFEMRVGGEDLVDGGLVVALGINGKVVGDADPEFV